MFWVWAISEPLSSILAMVSRPSKTSSMRSWSKSWASASKVVRYSQSDRPIHWRAYSLRPS